MLPIVANYDQFFNLTNKFNNGPIKNHYQTPYYDNPIFHTSIAWMLTSYHGFNKDELINHTNTATELFSSKLRSLGAFNLENVNVKISKDVFTFKLNGS